MNTITFKTTKTDADLILKIALRAVAEYGGDLTETCMDITACHANGNPLDLEKLLAFDNANFGHDVNGIGKYLDRETGALTRFFSPRSSKP